MGKKGTSVLKRQRELKKAEKAAEKRERRTEQGGADRKPGPQVASADDLRGYGMVDEDEPPHKQPS